MWLVPAKRADMNTTQHTSPDRINGQEQHLTLYKMALPLPPGLNPPEIAFLCEMELVTVIPRQRLEGLELLGVCMSHQHRHPAMSLCSITSAVKVMMNMHLGLNAD